MGYICAEVTNMDETFDAATADCIVVRADENGVTIIGLTRGKDTRFTHTEKLDDGEVLVAQFTENISAIKIRGKATILTRHGTVKSGGQP
jgi:transcription attenuation protein (tryptophan RNA-binding attenuator protein)